VLVHEPSLFILDEPTAALDPLLKRHLWKRFRRLVADRTLLISTHLIDEAMLCDSVMLLQHGKLVAHDAPRKLIARGSAALSFHVGAKQWTETVAADGGAMAAALQRYGLSKDIDRLDIDAENLEDVMVALLKEQKKE
jgi:ABC-2 type transport system ATP-binding protein